MTFAGPARLEIAKRLQGEGERRYLRLNRKPFRVLARQGYVNVISTTDPLEIEPLQCVHDFDLILLDIRMPKMDGFQVMERLEEIIADDYLPVLVLTAQTDNETRLRALDMGAKDFITKPFQKNEVLLRIDIMLQVRAAYNQKRQLNELLEKKVRLRTAEVVDTQYEIIRRLARAGEYRDNETGMHVIRVGKSAQRLARALGYGDRFCDLMMHASTMHDVGKIGVPDRVLLKPGKLDGEEWALMREHAAVGANILDEHGADVMKLAKVIALTHHEKWNGEGYPNGLKGADIPIEGRITAICDVFDALTSVRPYKDAWSVEAASAEVRNASGSHFDPDLVPKFVEILPGIVALRDRYSDDEAELGGRWTQWITGYNNYRDVALA